MNWNGIISSGDGWFSYRGECADNAPHAHAALQVVVAHLGTVALYSETCGRVQGRAVLVRSNIRHRLEPCQDAVLLLLEPRSPLAYFLDRSTPSGDVVPLDDELCGLLLPNECSDTNLTALIAKAVALPLPAIDVRLDKALELLSAMDGPQPVARAASAVGISTARLRTLAKKDLGWPLYDWFAWRRLEQAVSSLKKGNSVASAAVDAGFADQAHLTKAMRRLLGITPGTLSGVLQNS